MYQRCIGYHYSHGPSQVQCSSLPETHRSLMLILLGLKKTRSSKDVSCMQRLYGKSPQTTYPFVLHDTLILPWNYMIRNGEMALFSTSCTGMTEGKAESCRPCQHLHRNQNVEKIVTRIKDGVHENTDFACLGFSGLQDILRGKNQRIEFHPLSQIEPGRAIAWKSSCIFREQDIQIDGYCKWEDATCRPRYQHRSYCEFDVASE